MKTAHVPILKYPRTLFLFFELKYVEGCKELLQLWGEDAIEGEIIVFFECGVQVNAITKQKIQL